MHKTPDKSADEARIFSDEERTVKIVLIITGLSTGGAEMMLLKLLENLDQKFTPTVISLTTIGEIGSRIRALGIPVEALGMHPGLPNPFSFFRLAIRIKTLRPDVVHTWMYHADLLGGLAARFAGIRAISWGIRHANLDADKTKAVTRGVVWVCARLSRWIPDKILCNSHVAREAHRCIGYATDKMVVIPNGFDLDRFNPDDEARTSLREELRVSSDTELVGMIGRFDPQKNHGGFVEAAAALHRRFPGVHFVLAGKDVTFDNVTLANAIRDAGLREVFHLLGVRTDMPRLMAGLDILALPSYGEAFPNVLGEAMACEVLCVVTDVGDSAFIVNDSGRVVPSGDMEGFAMAMQELIALPERERAVLGQRARARIAEKFEIGRVVRRYEVFYEDLAKRSRIKTVEGFNGD